MICEKLIQFHEIRSAKYIASYYSFDGEIDLSMFIKWAIKENKSILLPRARNGDSDMKYEMVPIKDIEKDLEPGRYNIPEPKEDIPSINISDNDNILWLVPGIAFDQEKSRADTCCHKGNPPAQKG